MKTIYKSALQFMEPDEISHHQSDLYLKVNGVSETLVSNYMYKSSVKRFISQIDKTLWFDIPFAYDPFWDNCPSQQNENMIK
jgi:hypothetical protein